MSENQPEEQQTTSGIPDEQLPPDLVPGEDNPLAEGLPPGEGEELLEGGKTADEMDDEPDEPQGAEQQDPEKASGPAHEHD